MTREEMMARMSEPEFRGWLAYDRIEPLPDAHWDAALIASTIARALGGDKKARLEDFLPRREKPKAARAGVLGAFAMIRAQAQAADEERRRREG
jgi:hypothetical protein